MICTAATLTGGRFVVWICANRTKVTGVLPRLEAGSTGG